MFKGGAPKGADCPFFASEYERMRTYEELYPPEGDWYDIPYRCLLSVGVPTLSFSQTTTLESRAEVVMQVKIEEAKTKKLVWSQVAKDHPDQRPRHSRSQHPFPAQS
jgi:hypothetical protein